MVRFDRERCTGCGLCVGDCNRRILTLREGKAEAVSDFCMECGHCAAICPTGAAAMEGMETGALPGQPCSPEQLMDLLRFRRSMRLYKEAPLGEAELRMVLEAGRLSPTAANRQPLRFVVLRERLGEITWRTLDTLEQLSETMQPDFPYYHYREKWKSIALDYRENGVDRLFYGAAAVVLVVGGDRLSVVTLDGGLAASRMELMAASLGLGACFIGFFDIAVAHNPSLKQLVGIGEEETLTATFTLGVPAVGYLRDAPRRPLNAVYL